MCLDNYFLHLPRRVVIGNHIRGNKRIGFMWLDSTTFPIFLTIVTTYAHILRIILQRFITVQFASQT